MGVSSLHTLCRITPVTEGTIRVSDELWPLVVITYPSRTEPDDWEAMFDAMRRIHERRARFYTLHDATRSGVPSAVERAVIARNTEALAGAVQRLLTGSCIVLESALVRGALTAMYWVAPSIPRSTLVANLPQGYYTAANEMKAAGLTLHPMHEARAR
jgi:hypothetical protein